LPTDYVSLLGREPAHVARPGSVDEVAGLVARADADGQAIIPWGGGTGQTYGYLPVRADIVLDLAAHLNRVVAHEPGDLTVTVEAGASLSDVQKVLGRAGQFLPLDPPGAFDGSATVGGILATNAFGPSRAGYGSARDWLIGLTVVDAAGRVIKGGGKVVKNVTGYDLPKLHIGALGTLGVIVEATFKVAPVPEATLALCFRLPFSSVTAGAFVQQLHAGAHPPALSVLHSGTLPAQFASPAPDECYLFAVFHGMAEVVRAARNHANDLAAAHDFAPATLLPPHLEKPLLSADAPSGSSRLRARLSGPPAAAFFQHEALRAACPLWEWVRTYPATGHTEAALKMGEDAAAAQAALHAFARVHPARLDLLKASPALRGETGDDDALWWPRPPAFALMRRLKETLDPHNTLNPGRFIGRI
jgi:glycolate oxidase FAD binding subunit